MTKMLVVQASSFAQDIDFVYNLVLYMTGFWFVVTNVAFFWLLWRYRARPGVSAQYVTGNEHHLKRWIEWPHYAIILCDLFIIVAAVQVWYHVKQDMPQADETVRVMSQQWAWSFVHPGPDGKLDTPDDIKTVDTLHVEVNKTYHFELESRDVLHSFSVPAFRLKQDAIPGRIIRGWFKPTRPGTYDLQCAEICGIGHGLMAGRVAVETAEQHAAWLASANAS
jgi:cytochrome c oxidase subunit 2